MKDLSIIYPVFVQVLLTYLLLLWMGRERFDAVSNRKTQPAPQPGANPIWPERAAIVSNAFHNQLEIPILFYAAAAFALLAGAADGTMIALAWLFAGSRIVHALIHTTYNTIPHRFLVYLFGTMVVLAMWIRIVLHVYASGA